MLNSAFFYFFYCVSAAAAGEEAKDNHYLDTVNEHHGEFIPLVCESFGVQTRYPLPSQPYLPLPTIPLLKVVFSDS